jgi:hypothetical protein
MVEFKDDDIGRLVSLELDPETNPMAKALGADRVKVYGKIIEFGDDYIKLQLLPPKPAGFVQGKKRVEKILYSDIIDYSF